MQNKNLKMLLISTFLIVLSFIHSASLPAHDFGFNLIGTKRNFQKNLLRNLQAHQAGIAIVTRPLTSTFYLGVSTEEDTENSIDENTSNPRKRGRFSSEFKNDLFKRFFPIDLQVHIFSFLSPLDLLATRQVSRSFCNLSNTSNYFNIKDYNPDFVLEENWMNLALSNFLFKHFENGRINDDDLLMTIRKVIFEISTQELSMGKNPDSLNLLLFFYEYQNGPNSYIPLSYNDLYIEIISRLSDQNLPKSIKYLEEIYHRYLSSKNLRRQDKAMFIDYYRKTLALLKTTPTPEEIMIHFDFHPDTPIERSLLKSFPMFFQVALFKLILPLCNNSLRFLEAIKMTSSTLTFSSVILEQLDKKIPNLSDAVFLVKSANTPIGSRAKHKRHPTGYVIGLDYLLSRNSANPFNLQDLLAMNPDINQLMREFLSKNTMSLTEIDMIAQMKEVGLFSGIQDKILLSDLNSVINGVHRLRLIGYSFAHSIIINSR
jgi:hypothetical protein